MNTAKGRLVPNPQANQVSPLPAYVYAHTSMDGTPFYIGRGYDRIAWEAERQHYWHYFVRKHLGGKYKVVILEEGLDNDQANLVKDAWVRQETPNLVNWQNPYRPENYQEQARFHALRDAARAKAAEAKTLETTDLHKAVLLYQECVDSVKEFASINTLGGMLGKLVEEERADIGLRGELVFLDRLTVCLKKLGRVDEARTAAVGYFNVYGADLRWSMAKTICKRVGLPPPPSVADDEAPIPPTETSRPPSFAPARPTLAPPPAIPQPAALTVENKERRSTLSSLWHGLVSLVIPGRT